MFMRVLITGASSGIGRDLAIEFAKRKYDLILVSRNEQKLEDIKNELINSFKIKAEYIVADLNVKENIEKVFDSYKDIDILVNNAGFGDFGFFSETDLDKELRIINTNITALHILTKLYYKEFKRKNKGRILNVASIAGFLPGPLMATYYASKNYVVKLSEAIREEIKREKLNIKISILCPGPVNTNFNNVANVKFAIKSLSSEYVAKYTVEKFLKGKFYIVPGFLVKCTRIFSKFIPTQIIAKCAYHVQMRKNK